MAMNRRMAPKNPVKVYEVMTFLNQRSVNGRVVINPPEKMAPLETHQTGESWYFCYVCGRSNLDQNKHLKHMKEHNGDGNSSEASYSNTDHTFYPKRDRNTISRFDDYEDEYFEPNSEDEPLINLRTHREEKEKRISCAVCQETFPKRSSLRVHIAEYHADHNRYTNCHLCGQVHMKRSQKSHEERNHNPANPFRCSYCICRLNSFHALQAHMSIIHPDQFVRVRNRDQVPPTTVESSSSAPTPPPKPKPIQSVRKGSRTVDDTVLYRCKKCQKTFKSLPALRGHFLIHTNEKPHECVLCSTHFRLASTLSSHKKVAHSGGSFPCRSCPCTFHLQQGLKAHVSQRHGDEEMPQEGYDSPTE